MHAADGHEIAAPLSRVRETGWGEGGPDTGAMRDSTAPLRLVLDATEATGP